MTTEKKLPYQKSRNKIPILTPGQWFFCFFSVFILFLILRNSEAAIGFVSNGLRLCAGTVIPSLFPFLVISELLVVSGTGEMIGRLLSGPFRKIFRVSGIGFTVFFLGAVCGFPVGARTAVSYYDRGLLSKRETERLLMFSNNPSSAFLVSAIGVSLFGSQLIGCVLFGVTLFSSTIVGFFGKFLYRDSVKNEERPVLHMPKTGIGIFTNAVTGAADSMVHVCAYVIFFAALTGTLKLLLETIGANEYISAFVTGLFELTSGVSDAAAIPDRGNALILTALFSGWSGLSVHMQILSITDGRGLCYRPYFIAKLIQGLLAAFWMWLAIHFFPILIDGTEKAVWLPLPSGGENFAERLCILTVGAFLVCLLFRILYFFKKHKKTGIG